MNVLAILPRFPFPVDKGDKLRAYHHLRHLAKNNRVSVFAVSDEPVSEKSLDELCSFCDGVTVFPLKKTGILLRLVRNVLGRLPYQTAYHFDKEADEILRKKIAETKPDVLFYQLLRTAEFAKSSYLPKVLDFQDPMSENVRLRLSYGFWWQRLAFGEEYRRLVKYEIQVAQHFNEVCIISSRDRENLPEPGKSKAEIVSNGIDTAYYVPSDSYIKSVDLVFVGAMSYLPNVEAAKYIVNEVLPALKKLGVDASVDIVGADPAPEVKALQFGTVAVTGRVLDTRPFYGRARVMVAPMFINTGIQNKILEAAAMGLPIVTTREANLPIGAEDGKELLLAGTPAEFAHQIKKLLQDEAFALSIADAGRSFVVRNFSWESCGEKLEMLLNKAVSGR